MEFHQTTFSLPNFGSLLFSTPRITLQTFHNTHPDLAGTLNAQRVLDRTQETNHTIYFTHDSVRLPWAVVRFAGKIPGIHAALGQLVDSLVFFFVMDERR